MADKPGSGPDHDHTGPQQRRTGTGVVSFRERLETGKFAVTAEIGPPSGADTAPVARKAAVLRGWVDAVNITDNQGSNVRLASWAGSLAALQAGLEPVMQMTCRDRNRIRSEEHTSNSSHRR